MNDLPEFVAPPPSVVDGRDEVYAACCGTRAGLCGMAGKAPLATTTIVLPSRDGAPKTNGGNGHVQSPAVHLVRVRLSLGENGEENNRLLLATVSLFRRFEGQDRFRAPYQRSARRGRAGFPQRHHTLLR